LKITETKTGYPSFSTYRLLEIIPKDSRSRTETQPNIQKINIDTEHLPFVKNIPCFVHIYINLPPGIYQSQTLPGDDLLFALLASRAGALGIFQLKPLGEETYGPMVLSMFVAQLGYPKIQCLILVDDRLGVSENLVPQT
jgi:hypothetical protein